MQLIADSQILLSPILLYYPLIVDSFYSVCSSDQYFADRMSLEISASHLLFVHIFLSYLSFNYNQSLAEYIVSRISLFCQMHYFSMAFAILLFYSYKL